MIILSAILFPVFGGVRANGQKVHCLSNLRQLVQATQLYASDYDRRLVPARVDTDGSDLGHTWCVLLEPYTQNRQLVTCPADEQPQMVAACTDLPPSYGINYGLTYLAGGTHLSWSLAAIPRTAALALFFDMKRTAQAMGSSYVAHRVSRRSERHLERVGGADLDGHAKAHRAKEVDAERYWNPDLP